MYNSTEIAYPGIAECGIREYPLQTSPVVSRQFPLDLSRPNTRLSLQQGRAYVEIYLMGKLRNSIQRVLSMRLDPS